MRDKIREKLSKVEQDNHVSILYACESGSRAWGFASCDSDYDVRFIYVHPRDWYLSIDLENKSDVIELALEDDLDVSGWDLRKALQLFYKSNPPLLEWLQSPIVYKSDEEFVKKFRRLLPIYYNPIACRFHYLQMAKNNYREYLRGEVVWLKKYLYVLRPLLAVRWIEMKGSVVPMEFEKLVQQVLDDKGAKKAIMKLVAQKQSGAELDRGEAIPVIDRFIEQELSRSEDHLIEFDRPTTGLLDKLFREFVSVR